MSPRTELPVPVPARLPEIDAALDPFNRSDSPGVIVAIARDGHLLYRRAVGMASLAHGVANTPGTRSRIGSTSKHFTALAIMLLAEDGLLDIDDMAQKHLPELPPLSAKGPTLRQLMQHTGGWRGHDELWVLSNGWAFHRAGCGLPAMARQSEMNFEPGTRMMYSNGGYHMLAKIVERVSGQGFNDFLKARICAPLGMNDTESIATDVEVCPGVADRYLPLAGGGWQHGIYPCEIDGSASMVSTVGDMLRWLAHMRGSDKIVGSAKTWELMTAHTTLSSGARVTYGLGLFRHDYRGVEVVHHAGAVLGASAQMLTVPSHGLDVIVLVNGAAIDPNALAFRAVDLLLADVLAPPEVRPLASDFAVLLGQRYHAPASGSVLGFFEVDGKLGLSLDGMPPAALHHGNGGLRSGLPERPLHDLEIDVSNLDRQRAPQRLALREAGQAHHLERLPDTPPDAASLAESLCGDYTSADLDATARISLVDGTLQLAMQGRHGQVVSALTPLSADVMIAAQIDPAMAQFGKSTLNVEREADRVVSLRLNTSRSRGLRLLR